LQTARYIGGDEALAALDLLTEVDVSEEVALLRDEVEQAAAKFEARLDAPLAVHTDGLERGSKCSKCEFRLVDGSSGDRNGFGECWGQLAAPKPHVLELYKVGLAKAPDRTPLVGWMWDRKLAGLLDAPLDGLVVKDPAKPGGDAMRQRRQIEYTQRRQVYVGPELRRKVEALRGPMHFIDFETSRIALPYHRGMRPYGLVTFQWSCHTVPARGAPPDHKDWLNSVDIWPNQAFAESLREAIGDSGPVLTWSHFERSVLKEIVDDLAAFGRNTPDLVAWITDVVENRIVDLHDWARCDYYHPGMRGRTSIKAVLEALWKSDERMRADLEAWSARRFEPDADPYLSLPPVEIDGVLRDVHEGTGAMDAYQEMMYGAHKHDPAVKTKWAALLKQYCALDTLSMVLIFEYWRRLVGLA
jgi:hypothetical protein